MEEKNMISTSQEMSFLQQEQGYFSKIRFPLGFPLAENKRILFQIDRKSVPINENGKFVEEYLSTRRKNCFHWQEYLKNQIKWLPTAVIRVLNRFFYDLNNGFHQQERKLQIKNHNVFFWTEKWVSAIGNKGFHEKYLWKKMKENGFQQPKKSISTRQIISCLQKLFSLISVEVSGI